MRNRVAVAALTAVLGLTAQTARGQNLLTNPDFDASVSGWTAGAAWIMGFWNVEDAAEPSSSGSMIVSNTLEFPSGGQGMFQCVPVEGDTLYEISSFAKLPASQGRTGFVNVQVNWYDDAACEGSSLSVVNPGFGDEGPDWREIFEEATSPPGAQSARYALVVFKQEAEGMLVGQFDAAFLPEPSAGTGALAALGALAVTRSVRRRARSGAAAGPRRA